MDVSNNFYSIMKNAAIIFYKSVLLNEAKSSSESLKYISYYHLGASQIELCEFLISLPAEILTNFKITKLWKADFQRLINNAKKNLFKAKELFPHIHLAHPFFKDWVSKLNILNETLTVDKKPLKLRIKKTAKGTEK
jgi:hypothetical protein